MRAKVFAALFFVCLWTGLYILAFSNSFAANVKTPTLGDLGVACFASLGWILLIHVSFNWVLKDKSKKPDNGLKKEGGSQCQC